MTTKNNVLEFSFAEGEVPMLVAQLQGGDGTPADLAGRSVVFNLRSLRKYKAVTIVNGGPCTVLSISGTITIVSGVATFSLSQAGILGNGMRLLINGKRYTVTNFDGTTGCTLVGAPDVTGAFFTAPGLVRYSGNITDTTTYLGDVEADFESFVTGQDPKTTAGQAQKFPNAQDTHLYGYITPKVV